MTDKLCRFSLIFPAWLPWLIGLIGVIILILSYRDKNSGTSGTLTIFGFQLNLTKFVISLVIIGLGVALGVAYSHQPFARWVGSQIPSSIDMTDPMVSVDLEYKPLGELITRLSRMDLYVIRVSPAASEVKITGRYINALCGADLVFQICQQKKKLICDVDKDSRIIRICTSNDSTTCDEKTL